MSTKSKEWGPDALVEWMLRSKNVSERNIDVLLQSKEQIKQAWYRDDRGTESFPMYTAHLFYEIESTIRGGHPQKRRIGKRKGIAVRVPSQLRDILPEKTVQQVHEYLYDEPFKDALAELHSDARPQAYKRIENSILNALRVADVGFEVLPKPRGNWLHRQLLSLITAVTQGKFTDADMAKLFDYFCPCGTEHNRETMKKFRWRLSRAHR